VRRTGGDTLPLLGLGDHQVNQHGWMKKHIVAKFNLALPRCLSLLYERH
jgi:hypothetical protein